MMKIRNPVNDTLLIRLNYRIQRIPAIKRKRFNEGAVLSLRNYCY